MTAYSDGESRNIAQSGVCQVILVFYERLLYLFMQVFRYLCCMPAIEEMKGRHSVDHILFPKYTSYTV
jgi:hypothetical protein